MNLNYYYVVTPKVNALFFFLGLMGLGVLLSRFDFTDGVGFGYIAVALMLYLSFRWELKTK